MIAFQERHKLIDTGQKYYIDCIEVMLEEFFGFGCEGFTMDLFNSIECNFGQDN